MNSAIYFIGLQFREKRIRSITNLKNSDEDFVIAKKRKKWVQFLKKREHLSQKHANAVLTDKENIMSTLSSTIFDFDFLYDQISNPIILSASLLRQFKRSKF